MKKKPKIIAPRTANKGGYQIQDVWFHRAKAAGYRARSAYKLLQIQETTHVIQQGMTVLDLGCAPGSWLQVISKEIGPAGLVLGVDLQEVERFPQKNIVTIVGDMTTDSTHREILDYLHAYSLSKQPIVTENREDLAGLPEHKPWGIKEKRPTKTFGLITSDVAPKTTGRNDDDQYHSAMLCLKVLEISETLLAKNGALVMKIFVGRDLPKVMAQSKKMFTSVNCIKPIACRDRSFEEYVVCRGFRG